MQETLAYGGWIQAGTESSAAATSKTDVAAAAAAATIVARVAAENAVVVFARRGCCMCHVLKLLLHGHGVSPAIFDVDEKDEGDVIDELSRIVGSAGRTPELPAVFFGGELFGGLEEIMGAHISGDLVPRLREARALWL